MHTLEYYCRNNAPFIDKSDNLPPDNDEDVLVTRFRKLFEKSPAYEGKLHSEEFMDDIYCKPGQHISVKVWYSIHENGVTFSSNPAFQELTNTLSLEKETWAVDEIDDNQLEHLLSDIRTSTSIQEVEGRSRTVATLVPNWLQNNSLKEHAKSDADAEENILKMIKDEIEFETAHGIILDEEGNGRWRESNQRGCPTPKTIEPDEDLIRRFEALGGPELPSVPTTAPPPKPLYSRDLVDETDTWCCKSFFLSLHSAKVAVRRIKTEHFYRYM